MAEGKKTRNSKTPMPQDILLNALKCNKKQSIACCSAVLQGQL